MTKTNPCYRFIQVILIPLLIIFSLMIFLSASYIQRKLFGLYFENRHIQFSYFSDIWIQILSFNLFSSYILFICFSKKNEFYNTIKIINLIIGVFLLIFTIIFLRDIFFFFKDLLKSLKLPEFNIYDIFYFTNKIGKTKVEKR